MVEGYIDVITMATAGFPATVAPLGTGTVINEDYGIFYGLESEAYGLWSTETLVVESGVVDPEDGFVPIQDWAEAKRRITLADHRAATEGIDAEVIDVRSLVPLDTDCILRSVTKTSRLYTVEENPRLCGWGA